MGEKTNRRRGGSGNEEVKGEMKSVCVGGLNLTVRYILYRHLRDRANARPHVQAGWWTMGRG